MLCNHLNRVENVIINFLLNSRELFKLYQESNNSKYLDIHVGL